MSCETSSQSKYVFRPSPPRPANTAGCRNKIFLGNDGNQWISEPNSRGIYSWRPLSRVVKSSSLAKKPVTKKVAKKVTKKSPKRVTKKVTKKL